MAKVANSFHPLLRPLFRPRQRAMREDVARGRLDKIGNLFIQSREGKTEDGFRLWIRGYGLTKADHEAGLTGHYVIFQLVQDSDGWRIVTNKDIQPIEKHPERARPKGVGMPNWGHPVLRSAKKSRVFWTEMDAKLHLQILIDEFPRSVKTKMATTAVRVYTKHPEHGSVVENIILRLETQPDHTCILSYIPDPSSRSSKLREEEDAIQGDFTKGVLLRSGQKKKKTVSPGKEIVERLREEKRAEAAAEAEEEVAPVVEGGAVARLAAARAKKAGRPAAPAPRTAPKPDAS